MIFAVVIQWRGRQTINQEDTALREEKSAKLQRGGTDHVQSVFGSTAEGNGPTAGTG
jgi:hypothetical protein